MPTQKGRRITFWEKQGRHWAFFKFVRVFPFGDASSLLTSFHSLRVIRSQREYSPHSSPTSASSFWLVIPSPTLSYMTSPPVMRAGLYALDHLAVVDGQFRHSSLAMSLSLYASEVRRRDLRRNTLTCMTFSLWMRSIQTRIRKRRISLMLNFWRGSQMLG